jgi:hypothetical protein
MSINSLTDEAIIQSMDFRRAVQDQVSKGASMEVAQAQNEKAVQRNPVSNARDVLFKYIPTESITLYIAATSASSALLSVFPGLTPMVVYWFFAILTPILVLLIYFGKRRAGNLAIPLSSVSKWPLWKMFAATVAFLVWALAVPGNPYIHGQNAGALIGLLAIFVSTMLRLFEPIFERVSA